MSDIWVNRITGEGSEDPNQLLANPYNWRKHPEYQKKALRGALKEVGWIQRTIVNTRTGHLVDGHLRVELAMQDGAASVPVIYVDLSEEEERVALASLDSITTLAETDQDMIEQLLDITQVQDDDLAAFFDTLKGISDLDEETEGEVDPDDAPNVHPDAVSKTGDVWLCGEHRVMCGDSTAWTDVDTLCDAQTIDMVWTDPPYNVDYKGADGMIGKDGKVHGAGIAHEAGIANDKMGDGEFLQFLSDAFSNAYMATKAGGPIYIAHADSEGYSFRGAMLAAGWDLKQNLIWVKNFAMLSRQDYNWQHEPILYGWKPGAAHCWYGEFDKKTVIDDAPDVREMDKSELVNLVRELRNALNTSIIREDKPKRNDSHPTMKPVALIVHMMKNSSRRGDLVLDLFGGSGSTLIAAERLGRKARLMELDPKYCDVIVRRFMEYTEQEAYLESTGEAFRQIKRVDT